MKTAHILVFLPIFATGVVSNTLSELEILSYEAPKVIRENFPYSLSGYDDEGAPIWIFEPGKWDLRKYVEMGGELLNALDIYMDQMFLRFRESARNSTTKQFTALSDMDKFDMRQAGHFKTVQFMMSKFVKFEQVIRTGELKQGWIVNGNFIWERIWNLAKPLLGALTAAVEVYGTNRDKWLPKIMKHLPKDQIPEYYGGLANHKPVKIFG